MVSWPVVSVIIPSFNRAHLLGHAIDSVLNQTYQSFEIIIIDDGSIDHTETLVKSYSDERIRYFKQPNRGQNSARNLGLRHAVGKYLSFLDSDDIWLPEMLEKQLSALSSLSVPACSYTLAARKIDERLEVVCNFNLSGSIYSEALRQGYVSHMITLMIPKEALEMIGGFDESFNVCDDDDFCLRLAKFFQFKLVKEPLAIINETSNSVISNKVNYADGWKNLILKFEADILTNCGQLVWLYHKVRISNLYLEAAEKKLAYSCMKDSGIYIRSAFTIRVYFKILSVLYRKRII